MIKMLCNYLHTAIFFLSVNFSLLIDDENATTLFKIFILDFLQILCVMKMHVNLHFTQVLSINKLVELIDYFLHRMDRCYGILTNISNAK